MATGNTTTGSLADSLETVISSALVVREHEGVMPQLVDRVTLGVGIGLSWNEVTYDQLASAQAITENTVLDNPQQFSDTSFSITPTVIGIETLITDRVRARITPKGYVKLGSLAQNSMQRKKNADGLAVLDGFSTSYCGAGSTLTHGHIGAAVAIIRGNSTEPGPEPIRCVLHSYQIKDIEDELRASIGTYTVTDGLTARVFTEGYRGKISGAQIFEDDTISIDTADDAKGGVFSKEAIVLVQGRAPHGEVKRAPEIGGGANIFYLYDEYAYGERRDHWGVEIYSDASTPSS